MKKQATGVYLLRDNQILFLVRNKENDDVHRPGMYLPIGGKIDPAESAEACAIREVAEESGIRVHSVKLRGIHYIRQRNTDDRADWINFIYTSDDFTGEPQAGREGHFEWVDKDKLATDHMYEGDVIYMGYLRDYDFHVAEFTYNDFEFENVELLYAK